MNNRANESKGKSSFEVIYGRTLDFHVIPKEGQEIPSVTAKLHHMKQLQEDLQSALEISHERMKNQYDRHVRQAPQYELGQKVWLDVKNIQLRRKSMKLAPKWLGPYEIIQKISPLNYKLRLPREMSRIHPVFHVNELRTHKESRIEGRKQPEPGPVEIEGQPEYEVDRILDSRIFRNQLQYRIRWKGYDESHDSWEPIRNLTNTDELITAFHHNHPTAPRSVAKTYKIPQKRRGRTSKHISANTTTTTTKLPCTLPPS